MFDAVLESSLLAERRLGAGAVVSVALHAGLLAFALWIAGGAPTPHRSDPVIVFRQPPVPGVVPAPLGSRAAPVERLERRRLPGNRNFLYERNDPVKEAPGTDLNSADTVGEPDGRPEGMPGAEPVGATRDIAAAPPAPSRPLKFNDAMVAPVKLSGPEPEYTEKALEHEVQGEMAVQCIVSVDGFLRECHVLRSLPFMDSAVVDALKKRRYRPALLQGKPVEVEFLFKIKLQLPQ